MFIEIIKFIFYSILIVVIAKYLLVKVLRSLAENLKLSPHIVGNIAGYATSVPELLTISISSFTGLIEASVFNVLSSNVINLIQYIAAIVLNKNMKELKNVAIKTDLILVVITIMIPILLLVFQMELNIILLPIFVFFAIFFNLVHVKAHKKYLNHVDEEILEIEEAYEKEEIRRNKKTYVYVLLLILSGVLLFLVGNALGNTLENLAIYFHISEVIIGIFLGFITSIPELITFFESQRHYKRIETNQTLGVVEATNNLFTSNILNLFVIQTIGIIIMSFL